MMTTATSRNNSLNSGPAAGHFGLKNLVALLRGEGHRALNGVSAFTLTTSVLQQLNTECRRHSLSEKGEADNTEIDRSDSGTEGNCAVSASRRGDREKGRKPRDHTEWQEHIQFVKDFMQYSPNLKLSCDSDVSAATISLHRFSNLTSLNLQRVPVQRLQGLHLLRNSLTTITVYKGLDKVKDLLELCGGDVSTPLAWPQLKFVSLVFNSLSELDDSLRLMPHVQVLDLSHNLLQTCQHFLEYLVDVRQMSLAFNDLTQVPLLSATTRASLTYLVLRGNNLDSLSGVEECVCLQQLDLGENCINKHNLLEPLSGLIHLKQLQVDGNPLSYHKLHRPLTASCLARPAANVQFELDKKKLTASEISYFSQVKARLTTSAAVSDLSKRAREAKGNLTSRDGVPGAIPPAAVLSEPDRDAQLGAATEPSNNRRKSRHKKGKLRDSRVVDIDDTDRSDDHHIVRPGSAPFPRHLEKLMTDRRQEAMKTRREIEELRKHYGHNWLQAIEDRGVFNKKLEPTVSPPLTPQPISDIKNGSTFGLESQTSTSSVVCQAAMLEVRADAQTAVKEEPAVDDGFGDSNKPFMTTIARLAAGLSEGGVDRAATCVSTGSGDPDVIKPPPRNAYSTTTLRDDDDGKTTMAGYRKLSLRDKADGDNTIHTRNRKIDPNSEDVKGRMFQDASTKHRSNIEARPTIQAGDTTRDPSQTDTESPMLQTLNTNSNPDHELTGNHNEASTCEVNLANTAQLPDVVPTRLVQTQQTQVAPTIRSGDTTPPAYKNTTPPAYKNTTPPAYKNTTPPAYKNTTPPAYKNTTPPAYKSSSYVSITSSKDGQTGESMGRRNSAAEDQEVIESMLVSCPLQDNEVILVTMTSQYLVEKNFRGKVTEKLELTSLNYLDWKWLDKPHNIQTAVLSDSRQPDGSADGQMLKDKKKGKSQGRAGGGEGSLQLNLRFDYLRKDKQSRCYILDVPDGNLLVSRLQPFLDLRESQLQAAVKTVLQCLKCNQILPQRELDPPRNSGKSAQEHTDLSGDAQMCPRCGSSLIIELTPSTGTPGARLHKRRKSQRPSMSGLSGKYKTTIPLVKKVFNSFTRKSQAEKVSTQSSSSSSSSSSSAAAAAAAAAGITAAGTRTSSPLLGRAHVSTTGHTDTLLPGHVSGRDRSSAFRAPANLARAVAEMDDREEMGDELICVEDYFSTDMVGPITSCQLAEITSSLRYDSPTRTSKAQVEQASYSVSPHTEHMSQYLSDDGSGNRLSQSYVDGARFESDASLQKLEHSSPPIRIEGGTNNISLPGELRQHRGVDRQASAGRADDTDTSMRGPAAREEHRKLSAASCSRRYERRVFVPTLATSLGGHRSSMDSSMKRSEHHGSMKHSDTSDSPAATATRRSDLARNVQHPAMVCSSVPKSISYLGGTHVRTGQFALTSGRVSPVFHSLVHSSLSSEESDPCQLSESPSGNEIHDPCRESSKPESGSHNSQGGVALVTSAVGDGLRGELQDDIVSIYDFSDEPRHSPRAGDVSVTSGVSHLSSEDNICQFEDVGGCPESLTVDSQGGDTPTNQCLPVEDTLDTGQCSNATEAAATATSAEDEAAVDDESNDDDVVPNYAFHHLNHRLTLFLMMSLFGTDEEFLCKIQCPIVQYIITEPYDGMLVMSSQRFYVLKFTSKDRRQPPDQWIQCVDIQPIPELRYIDVGLGGQSLRLEFVTDCSSFTLITGNRDKTVQFVEALHRHLTRYASHHGMNSTVVVHEDTDQSTVDNLDRDVLSKVTPGQKLLYYCMGVQEKGQGECSSVSVVVTCSDVCLVRANHQWPQPRLQGPVTVETVGKQFTVLERQRINNVASLKVCPISLRKVRLELFSGGDGQSSCWNITLASRQSMGDLIDAISGPWAEQFGVGLEVIHARLDF